MVVGEYRQEFRPVAGVAKFDKKVLYSFSPSFFNFLGWPKISRQIDAFVVAGLSTDRSPVGRFPVSRWVLLTYCFYTINASLRDLPGEPSVLTITHIFPTF